MLRIAVVIGIPVLLGLIGGPLLLLWGSRGVITEAALGTHAMAAAWGLGLGLIAAGANLLGALIVNKIGLRSWAVNTTMFLIVAVASFGFLIDWLNTMMHVVAGMDLLAERTVPWLLFGLNLILCCAVHRRRSSFLPKKVRT